MLSGWCRARSAASPAPGECGVPGPGEVLSPTDGQIESRAALTIGSRRPSHRYGAAAGIRAVHQPTTLPRSRAPAGLTVTASHDARHRPHPATPSADDCHPKRRGRPCHSRPAAQPATCLIASPASVWLIRSVRLTRSARSGRRGPPERNDEVAQATARCHSDPASVPRRPSPTAVVSRPDGANNEHDHWLRCCDPRAGPNPMARSVQYQLFA